LKGRRILRPASHGFGSGFDKHSSANGDDSPMFDVNLTLVRPSPIFMVIDLRYILFLGCLKSPVFFAKYVGGATEKTGD